MSTNHREDRLISRRAFLQRVGVVSSAAVALPLIAACAPTTPAQPATEGDSGTTEASTATEATPQSGGELRFGQNNEADTLDPARSANASAYIIMMNIYDTLVWLDPADNVFKPGLAEAWESSEDGLSHTFTLKAGVTFHDGTPLTAEAVKYSFDRIKDPATKSSLPLGKLGPYKETVVVDELTAQVMLESPYPGFFDGISQTWLAIVSPAAAQAAGEDFGRNPVGTGFMKFKEWVTNDHITLERNADYNWGPAFWDHTGPAYLDQLTFVPVLDNPARLTAFESGDLHIIEQVPEQDFDRLKATGEFQMMTSPNPGAPMTLFMNTQLGPTADINVRKAILHGMDHQQLIDIALFGLYTVVEGPISPVTAYYSPKVEGLYPYDVAKAESLLDEAGWVMGDDGIRAKDGEKLVLDFVNWPPGETVVLAAQGLLKPLGIEIVAQIFDQPTRVQMGHNGEGNIFMNTVVDTDPGGVGLFYHSKNMGTFNWPRFADEQIDAALDQQQVETDPAKRAQLLEDFQLRVMENALIYPAYLFARLHAVAAAVQGFRVSPLGTYPYFYEMWLA